MLAYWNNSPRVDMLLYIETRVDMLLYIDTGRHVAVHWHIILIPRQPVFVLTPQHRVLTREATNTNFKVLGLVRLGIEPMIYHTRDMHANN